MSVYDEIARLCLERGIAVTALERELGFGRGSIGKLKKGATMGAERLQKVADYFGVSTDELLGVPKMGQHPEYYINDEVAEIAQEIHDDPDLHMLFSALRGSSKKSLQAMREMVEGFKETNPDG